MASDELAVLEEERHGAIQLLLALEAEGKADEVSLTLTDPDMPYETWEAMGRFLGSIDRRSRWYVGDWLNFGEAIYGEASAQGIDDTTRTRYNEAERVTGLDHGTLLNIRSVCGKVARSRRRSELGFWIHAEVAPLDPEEQIEWLQKAIDNAWTRAELRDAIRLVKNPQIEPPDGDEPPPNPVGEGLTLAERLEAAARIVFQTWQSTSDGSYLVPPESAAQLKAALGEE
jgi:hypothetical protein